jgi:hypothetical protein
MRSELVYRANDKVENRFQLCRLASSAARTMNRNSVAMQSTINQALEAISGQPLPVTKKPPHRDEANAGTADTADTPALIADAAV